MKTWEDNSNARGARLVRLVVEVLCYDDLGAGGGRILRLDPATLPLVFGRNDEAAPAPSASEIRVEDKFASVRHAMLFRRGGDDVLGDLSSRNGTWINGERIEERPLQDHDLFEIGHTLFCYRVVDEQAAQALEASPTARTIGPTVTRSADLAGILRDLTRIAPSEIPVLILGETGAGKESVALTVHALSGRRGPLQAVDCGAIPETLFESTFFGHKRGAFTGAAQAHAGEIVAAEGGTVLLDEVGNLPLAAQAKLLRAIEERRVRPLGATESIAVDVRWVAATNAALEGDESSFRSDLLQRLSGYVVRLPPLRRRREDLGAIAAHALAAVGKKTAVITASAARTFFSGAFPGNARQLRTAIQTATLLAKDEPIDASHLALTPSNAPSSAVGASGFPSFPPPRSLSQPPLPSIDRSDKKSIEDALAETGGNMVRAAAKLGTHPRQLYRWIERWGIELDRFRA
ncbi:MAG: sigma 54-interacting transcriptional regulator [Polyangiales bacterium]